MSILARLVLEVGIVSEDALRVATDRFERRFLEAQGLAKRSGRRLDDCDEGELDALWEEAKRRLSTSQTQN